MAAHPPVKNKPLEAVMKPVERRPSDAFSAPSPCSSSSSLACSSIANEMSYTSTPAAEFETEEMKMARRKAQCRKNQAKYRRKRKAYEIGLPEHVQQLRQDVHDLEALHRHLVETHQETTKGTTSRSIPPASRLPPPPPVGRSRSASVQHDFAKAHQFVQTLISPCWVPHKPYDIPDSYLEEHVAMDVMMHQYIGLPAFLTAWTRVATRMQQCHVIHASIRYDHRALGELAMLTLHFDLAIPLTQRDFETSVVCPVQLVFEFNGNDLLSQVHLELDMWQPLMKLYDHNLVAVAEAVSRFPSLVD